MGPAVDAQVAVEEIRLHQAVAAVGTEAAHLAGKAINITTTTAAHAISYPITTYFNVPHGHAVALTLGEFFLINADVTNNVVVDSRGEEYLLKTMME